MGLEALDEENCDFRRFWGYLWNFLVAGSFGPKEHGLLRSLGIFQGFWWIFGRFRVV
jgi:hypothetical protein